MKHKQYLTYAAPYTAIALVCSVSLFSGAAGLMLTSISADYAIGMAVVGLIPSLISGGEFLAYILGGFWKRRSLGRLELTGFFACLLVTVLSISLRPPFAVLCLLYGLLGLLVGLVNFVSNTVVASSFQKNRGRYISILYIAMGVGCSLCPYYPTMLLDRGVYWGNVYRHYSLYIGIVAVAALGVLLPRIHMAGDISCGVRSQAGGENALHFLRRTGRRRLGLLCLTAFMYQGHQIALCSWLPSYMTQWLHVDSVCAGVALSLFSAGLLASRLISAFLSKRFTTQRMIVSGCLLGAILLCAGLLACNATALLIACPLAGVVTGWILPMIISWGYDCFPENPVAVASTINTASALGGMTFSWLTGAIASYSFPIAISLTAINLLIAAVLTLALQAGTSE